MKALFVFINYAECAEFGGKIDLNQGLKCHLFTALSAGW